MNSDILKRTVEKTNLYTNYGKVTDIVGLVVESLGPDNVSVGELCYIGGRYDDGIRAEVVGFRGRKILLMPLGEIEGIRLGTSVFRANRQFSIPVGRGLLGRVVNGLGEPIDGKGPIHSESVKTLQSKPPDPLSRRRVKEPLGTGVKALDGLVSLGLGQRMGIFAGSGVGKSTLMGMIALHSSADVNVIALVGERGKEVLDFIEDMLGPDGLRRSVVVVATSDQPALIRLKAPFVATAIAEYFRDFGNDVILMMDSLTRVAMAQREVGLAAGEPPTSRGYTPSVFALLPRLLERAGMTESGSITGLYTVLVEGDDFDEPIADASRAILDGHLILSRTLASRGHFPPIDVMESVSRVMKDVVSEAHWKGAMDAKEMVAAYTEAEDLINIGAYKQGNNPRIDRALHFIEPLNEYLRQGLEHKFDIGFDENIQTLLGVLANSPSDNNVEAINVV